MLDGLRRALRDLLDHPGSPDERRAAIARMRDTLVQARVGLDDLRAGLEAQRARLEAERRELATVQRRRGLAEQIGDRETVAIADRYAAQHAERVALLERKVELQAQELALAEREVAEMTAELRKAAGPLGAAPPPPAAVEDPLDDRLQEELDTLRRRQERASTEADAAARLAELKRRMGK